MTFMCAWCNEKIREFGGKPGMAHGICPDCRAKFFPETLRTVQENAQAIVWDCLRAIGNASAAVLLLLLVLGVPCFAGETAILPDKPQPQIQEKTATADKEFWIEAGTLGGAWMADTISTHSAFANNPRSYEGGMLFHGSHSAPQVMGAWAAVDLGAMAAAYEWKKHVHNRYLHPLWRVIPVVGIVGHTRSAVLNSSALPPR